MVTVASSMNSLAPTEVRAVTSWTLLAPRVCGWQDPAGRVGIGSGQPHNAKQRIRIRLLRMSPPGAMFASSDCDTRWYKCTCGDSAFVVLGPKDERQLTFLLRVKLLHRAHFCAGSPEIGDRARRSPRPTWAEIWPATCCFSDGEEVRL